MTDEKFAPLIYNEIHSDQYFISTHGRVKNIKTGKFLKPQDSGYLHIRIKHGGKYVNIRIHKAVCETFVYKPRGWQKMVVNHKDSNKKNNHADNLEFITQAENVKHSINYRAELLEEPETKTYVFSVPVSGFRTYVIEASDEDDAKKALRDASTKHDSSFVYENYEAAVINKGGF